MPIIEIQDINALAELAIVVSCLFLFYKWKKINYSFAVSFILVAFVFFENFFISIFMISEEVELFVRGINSIILAVSLAYACTQILTNCKRLYPVFALYLLFPISFLFTNNLNYIYVLLRLIGVTILLPYFILLFAVKHREIKIISFLGICAIGTAVFLWLASLNQPEIMPLLPWYIPRVLSAALLLGLAHFSIHMPDSVIDHHFRKRKGKK